MSASHDQGFDEIYSVAREFVSGDDAEKRRRAAGLVRYLRELITGNPRFGLISRSDAADPRRLFVRHIHDVVAPYRIIADRTLSAGYTTMYDLGSGAGIPGIPLAVVFGTELAETLLVERRRRRVAFLRGVVPAIRREAGAAPISILDTDAEALRVDSEGKSGSPFVVFRAYRGTDESLLRSIAAVFPRGTPIIAYKGRRDETERERARVARSAYAVTDVPGEEPTVVPYEVPGLEAERCVLVWKTTNPEGRGDEDDSLGV